MEVRNIPIPFITASPMNPRKTFDETAIRELADNIRSQGLLQPITVRPVPAQLGKAQYEIVCGERRYRAFRLIAAENVNAPRTIPAIVKEMDDDEAFDAMVTENLQRKDVDPMEEAFAFEQLMSKVNTLVEKYRDAKTTMYKSAVSPLGDIIEKRQTLDDKPLTYEERVAMTTLMAYDLGHECLHDIGVKSYNGDEAYKLISADDAMQRRLIKRWLYEKLIEQCERMGWNYSASIVDALISIGTQIDSHATDQLIAKSEKAAERKCARLEAELKELGYDTEGKKLS